MLRCWKSLLITASAVAASLAPVSAFAHHSYAAFDRSRRAQISGAVVSWEWTNPHSHLGVMAPDDSGVMRTYDLELSSPNSLRASGWTRDAFAPGDKVKVEFYPRHDGGTGGNVIIVTKADGRIYGHEPEIPTSERK